MGERCVRLAPRSRCLPRLGPRPCPPTAPPIPHPRPQSPLRPRPPSPPHSGPLQRRGLRMRSCGGRRRCCPRLWLRLTHRPGRRLGWPRCSCRALYGGSWRAGLCWMCLCRVCLCRVFRRWLSQCWPARGVRTSVTRRRKQGREQGPPFPPAPLDRKRLSLPPSPHPRTVPTAPHHSTPDHRPMPPVGRRNGATNGLSRTGGVR